MRHENIPKNHHTFEILQTAINDHRPDVDIIPGLMMSFDKYLVRILE